MDRGAEPQDEVLFAEEEAVFDEEPIPPAEEEVPPTDDTTEIPPTDDTTEIPPPNDEDVVPPTDDTSEIPPPSDDGEPITPPETNTKNTNEAATDANVDAASAEAAADAEAAAEAEAADMDAYVVRDARCRFGAPDTDGDGLCDALELEFGTDPSLPDTDGDALSDGMEIAGYRVRRTRELVTLPNASPLHYDVYVDISYVPGWRPTDNAIQWIVDVFANAPVQNKDGTTGITLHTMIDDEAPVDAPALVTFPAKYRELKGRYFQASHTAAYHWALFAGAYDGSGSSGSSSGAPSTEFIVTLGGKGFSNSEAEQAGTFMHELGHNLGLPHGGLTPDRSGKLVMDHSNYKASYFSVMNYAYQTHGIPGADGSFFFDYSRATVGALNESQLNELRGFRVPGTDEAELARYGAPFICTAQEKVAGLDVCTDGAWLTGSPSDALDLNRNQCIDSNIVAADLNGMNGTNDVIPVAKDDWTNLTFHGGNVIGKLRRIGARVAVVEEPPITCLTAETNDTISRVAVDTTPPPLCAAAPAEL